MPGDCGSSWPTRVEPRLHCVGIEWQVRGRCMGSAAHSPLHALAARALSAARAIEPRPTHFARFPALGVPPFIKQPAHFAWARAFCVGPRTLRGPAHFAWARALCNPRAWRPMHCYPFPYNFQPIQFAIQSNYAQYYLKPIPFLTQGRYHNLLHNLLIMPQIHQISNRTNGFLTSWHFKTLRNIEICT